MLKEIRKQLITDIKTGVSIGGKQIALVDKYRGEFSESSDWNPRPSACFLQVINKRPRVKANDNTTLRYAMVIKIYAGAKFNDPAVPAPGTDALDVAEAVMDALDGMTLTVEDKKYKMSLTPAGMDLILYSKGFEAYAFDLMLE